MLHFTWKEDYLVLFLCLGFIVGCGGVLEFLSYLCSYHIQNIQIKIQFPNDNCMSQLNLYIFVNMLTYTNSRALSHTSRRNK